MGSSSSAPPASSSSSTALAVGPGAVVVGKYRVDHVIGRGGMGQVVAATHLALEERVAIKFLLPEALRSEEVVARFRREAQASVRLRSEHVCRVFDVGETEAGLPFIVMEYLEGKDLSTLLKEKKRAGASWLPIREALLYVLQAAEGLSEAHALGIVHRDVKPANLFRAKRADGTASVKVLDFGIAKTTESSQQVGLVMGSVHYMSPEQAQRGRTVDARSDVWSLAAVLYQLLSGISPFDREMLHESVAAIVADEPESLVKYRDDLPDGLERVVLQGLAKDREARHASMADFAAALAPFAGKAGARQAVRVRAVFDQRRRSLVPSAPNQPPPTSEPTRFDLATRTLGDVVPEAPPHRRSHPVIVTAALVAVAAVVFAVRTGTTGNTTAAQPADAAASTVASASASPTPEHVLPPPDAKGPTSTETSEPRPAVSSQASTAAAGTSTARDGKPSRSTREPPRATVVRTEAAPDVTAAVAPAKPPPAKAAPSPCRDILTDEPIPCR